jgi:ADP-heptose:LPS heptosyltransferase
MKILIIQPYRLGDVLQVTPVLQALKKKYKEISIDFVVDEVCADVVRDNPYISRLFVLDRGDIRRAAESDGLRKTAAFFGIIRDTRYDLAISFNFGPIGGMLLDACTAKEKRGVSYGSGRYMLSDIWTKYALAAVKKREFSKINICDVCKLMAGCGGISSRMYLKDTLSPAFIKKKFMDFKEDLPVVAVQGSGSKNYKSLKPGQNRALIEYLCRDYNVVFLGAKGSEENIGGLSDSARLKDLTGKTTLREHISVIKNSDLLLTPDTFASHVAAAVGTKAIVYFLAGVFPFETAPYGGDTYVMYTPVKCGPCDPPDKCGDRKCAAFITPELIYSGALAVMSGKAPEDSENVSILRPVVEDMLYFDDEHKEYIHTIKNAMDSIGRGEKPETVTKPALNKAFRGLYDKIVENGDYLYPAKKTAG